MVAYRRRKITAPRILELDSKWKYALNLTPCCFNPEEKKFLAPIEWEAG